MEENSSDAILINQKDNIAVSIKDIKKGDIIKVKNGESIFKIKLLQDIPFGHKLATCNILEKEKIVKYGEVIGLSTKGINAGEHVHVHNITGIRGKR